MKTIHIPLLAICLLVSAALFSQTTSNIQQALSINNDGSVPTESAILDVQSINQGMLVPRMNSMQRVDIDSPATGLLVFDTDESSFWFFDGANWVNLSSAVEISDEDEDTKIQVEESADEDIIRFDASGSERLRIDNTSSEFEGLLTVNNGSLLMDGTTGTLPANGAGTRLMWVPDQAAFRCGIVNNDEWDSSNIGNYSTVVGGEDNIASGFRSIVGGGRLDTASAINAFVGGGQNNKAAGGSSFIGGGGQNQTFGPVSFIGGGSNNLISLSGGGSFIGGGNFNSALTIGSFIGGGFENSTSGVYSFIGGGRELLAKSFCETVVGLFNEDYTPVSIGGYNQADRLFVIGNGLSDTTRSNALTVMKSGRTGIGRIPTTNLLEVDGDASKNSAGDWLANSDARLKKDIQKLDAADMLQKFLSLQGITYQWNDGQTGTKRPEGKHYGFTAQNIQEVFPTLVEEDNLGFLQTAYGTYDAMTVEAIRALNDKIDSQNNLIQNLQSEISKLKDEFVQKENTVSQQGKK